MMKVGMTLDGEVDDPEDDNDVIDDCIWWWLRW